MTLDGMERRLGKVEIVETDELSGSDVAYLKALGTGRLVANVAAEIRAIRGSGFVLPLVSPDSGKRNCYVCSFRSHFGDYARYEIDVRELGFLGGALKGCLVGLEGLMRFAKSEHCVFVNNWLLSTNIYPSGLEDWVSEIRDRVLQVEPQRAIVFRSLNPRSNAALVRALGRNGFLAICSREIYLLDTKQGTHRKCCNFRKDLRFFDASDLEVVRQEAFSDADLICAHRLYGKLYLEKYTQLNPHFTLAMFQEGVKCGFLDLLGLKWEGELVGVLGYYRCEDWITAPILGYDTDLPRSLGLYRMLTLLLTLEGERLGCAVHRSSGAAQFKRSRGAVREREYSYVYVEHLSWWRRAAWKLLAGVVNRVAKFSLQRIEI